MALLLLAMLTVVVSRQLEGGSPSQPGGGAGAASDVYGRLDEAFELSTSLDMSHDSEMGGPLLRGVNPFTTPLSIVSSMRSMLRSATAAHNGRVGDTVQ